MTPRSLAAICLCAWLLALSCSENTKETPEVHISGTVANARDSSYVAFDRFLGTDATSYFIGYDSVPTVSYTHLTLPTIYSV